MSIYCVGTEGNDQNCCEELNLRVGGRSSSIYIYMEQTSVSIILCCIVHSEL